MIDPITASIVIVLGKYALDKGAELAKEVGPTAVQKASELFQTALDYLRRDPNQKAIVERFEKNPKTAAPLLEEDLQAAIHSNAELAKQLKEMLEQYEAAAKVYTADTRAPYQANLQGSGAIAQGPGAQAYGERAVHVGGNVAGPIITGNQSTVSSGYVPPPGPYISPVLSPALETLRGKITYHFNVEELKNLCQDMNIVYENLAGEGREGQVRELIAYCERHGRLDTLTAECKRRRPTADWV